MNASTIQIDKMWNNPRLRRFRAEHGPSIFALWACAGLLCSLLFCMLIGLLRRLPLVPTLACQCGTVLSLFVMIQLSRIQPRIISMTAYCQTVLTVAIYAMLLPLFSRNVLTFLDIEILGIGLLLATARLGCLSVGCCHGRPSRWGMLYGPEQVQTGFPSWLAGVRLFPIQAVESLWVFGIVAAGTIWIWRESVPGSVFAFYIVAYAAGRFFLEFFRGDEGRRYLLGFSEAQWTSVVLVAAVNLAERAHVLPVQTFPVLALAVLMTAVLAISSARTSRKFRSRSLFTATQLNELARALKFLQDLPITSTDALDTFRAIPIHVVCTSEGLKISLGRIRRFTRPLLHFSLSSEGSPLTAKDAKSLARVIGYLCGSAVPFHVVAGTSGVFHVIGAEAPIEVTGNVRAVPAYAENRHEGATHDPPLAPCATSSR